MTRTAPTALAVLLLLVAPRGAAAEPSGPPESPFSEQDLALMAELVAGLRPDLAAGGAIDPAVAAQQLSPFLAREGAARLLPRWLAHAKESFAHPTAGWVGDRTATLVVFGPPGGIHRESERAWSGEQGRLAPSTWDLMLLLAGEESRTPPEELTLDWGMPTEIWVYPQGEGQDLVVFYFADVDGDGVYRLVLRKKVPATERVSSASLVELPATLYGADAEIQAIEGAASLPDLGEDPVGVRLATGFFKATEGRTATRFVVAVDPTDLELELDVDPVEYLADARVWLRVSRDGEPVYQDAFTPNPSALADLAEGFVDELTTVPLAAGAYEATVVLTDGSGRGGRSERALEVPSMTGDIGLSSVILTRAEGGTIPKASGGEGEFVAFQVGNYVVRPHVAAEFRPGDTLGLVVQVYNAAQATLEYDLYKDGRLANSLDPVAIRTLPATDIQLIEVLDVWPAGSYAFKVTAVDGSDPSRKVTREVAFRVRK